MGPAWFIEVFSKSLGPNFPGLLSTVKHDVRTMACRMGIGDQDMIAQSKA